MESKDESRGLRQEMDEAPWLALWEILIEDLTEKELTPECVMENMALARTMARSTHASIRQHLVDSQPKDRFLNDIYRGATVTQELWLNEEKNTSTCW